MSIVRVCDCDCHRDGEASILGGDYASFGGRDVCSPCLRYCRHWRAWVAEPPTEGSIDRLVFEVYKDRIKVQLESLPLGRKR